LSTRELLRYGQDVLDKKFFGKVKILKELSYTDILAGVDNYFSDEDGSVITIDTELSSPVKAPMVVKGGRMIDVDVYINKYIPDPSTNKI
jgi:hypothetical protein